MPNRNLSDIRREYADTPLRRADLADDPFEQLRQWLDAAEQAGMRDPTAMTLATVAADGMPQARIVLLKGLDEGLIFYGHGLSRKGRALASNPRAGALFFWDVLDRQVRIEGRVERLDRDSVCRYFASRPPESQLAALISRQSWPVADRATLERRLTQARETYGDAPPCPSLWQGYRLVPSRFEFWQGRPNRLHDRFLYALQEGRWRIERLAP